MLRAHTQKLCGLIILCIAMILVSCAQTSSVSPFASNEGSIVWPQQPAQARIAYIKSFTTPEDIGITKGFFRRIGELILGSADRRLIRPMAVVVTSDEVVYVADPGAKGVHRFNTRKGRYRLIRQKKGAVLPSPVGLAMGKQGEVYVTDSFLGKIFVINPRAKIARPIALAKKLNNPTGIALDPETGDLYVVETGNHRVKIFSKRGDPLAEFGQRGGAKGQFNFPTMIWRDQTGRLLVSDSLNFRIQAFDSDGKFLQLFGKLGDGTGDLSRPKGVATDRLGHVYIVDSMFHALQVFDASGEFLLHIGGQGHAPGEFWLPNGIYIGEKNTIYIADSHNRRVQVFRYIGDPS